jgi:hypothetical protein
MGPIGKCFFALGWKGVQGTNTLAYLALEATRENYRKKKYKGNRRQTYHPYKKVIVLGNDTHASWCTFFEILTLMH